MLGHQETTVEQPSINYSAYEKTPFLTQLTDESRKKLRALNIITKLLEIDTGAAKLSVETLAWPGMEKDIEDLVIMLGETVDCTLGNLTDQEFRKKLYKFEGVNDFYSHYFQNRIVGEVGFREAILADRFRIFVGALSDFYSRATVSLGGENENLTNPAEGHMLAAREHMLWVPANLRLDDLSIGVHEKRVVRFVALLHDWGKAVMERNGQHPEIGASMIWSVLFFLHQKNPNLYPLGLIKNVCWAIKMHHMLERVFSPTNEKSIEAVEQQSNLDDQQFAQRVVVMLLWLQDTVAQTDLHTLVFEPVISKQQVNELLERLKILATLAAPASENMSSQALTTLEAIAELRNLQLDREPNTPSLILGLVRMIEADLIASDRETKEIEKRLNQLKLLTQGFVATL